MSERISAGKSYSYHFLNFYLDFVRGVRQERVYFDFCYFRRKVYYSGMHNLVALGYCQMAFACMNHYTTQVIGVILALLDDLDESVQLTAVSCLLMVTTQYF